MDIVFCVLQKVPRPFKATTPLLTTGAFYFPPGEKNAPLTPPAVNNIQILTASSAMVKTMTPEVIPGAFYFPEAKPRENRTLRGSPRES